MKNRFPTVKDRNARYLIANAFAKLASFCARELREKPDSDNEEHVEEDTENAKGKNAKTKNHGKQREKIAQEDEEETEEEADEAETVKVQEKGKGKDKIEEDEDEIEEQEEEEEEASTAPKKRRKKVIKSPHNTPPIPEPTFTRAQCKGTFSAEVEWHNAATFMTTRRKE